jgi:hypothetical protein
LSRPRPAALRRHLRRPLWWFLLALGVGAVWLASDVAGAHRTEHQREQWPAVTGSARGDLEPGRHTVHVSYRHPITGQVVTASVIVVKDSLVPRPGGPMRIAPDPANPDHVVVPGDGNEVPSTVIGVAAIVGVAAIAALVRWLSFRHLERLVSRPSPGFAMLGALTVTGIRDRVMLALYPLDAPAGARPVCTVPVLTTGGLPIDGPCFPVEVRGRPVPGGPVVARAAEVILWPLRRPIGAGSLPRPEDQRGEAPLLAAASPPTGVRAPSLPRVLSCSRGYTAGGVLLGAALLSGIVFLHHRSSESLYAHGTAVIARVFDKTDDSHVRVVFTVPGDPPHTYEESAPADSAKRTIGQLYPAHVSKTDPTDIRLDADPYDAGTPLVFILPAAVLAVALALPLVRWQRGARALEQSGSWSSGTLNIVGEVGSVGPVDSDGWSVAARVRFVRWPGNSLVSVAGSLDPREPVLFAGLATAIGPTPVAPARRR